MEVPCPQCGQQLRVPEGLRFARVRCRACEYVFTTSTSESSLAAIDSGFANRERFESDRDASSSAPYAAEAVEDCPASEQFDSDQMPVTPVTTAPTRHWKTRFGVVFFILMALLTKGPQVMKLFQPKRRPPPPVVRPVKEARDPQRKLGEELKPPKEPILRKFNRQSDKPPAELEEKGE